MTPYEIPEEKMPLFVFSDCTSGLIEFFIKFRTKGDYNHVMLQCRPRFFASQGNTYSEAPVERYMKRGSRLKYVEVVGLTAVQKALIKSSVNKKLALPWFRKAYDWLGIVGQAVGIPGISTPGLDYCSEDAPRHFIFMANKGMQDDDPRKAAILGMGGHKSPQALNDYMKRYPDVFRVTTKWEADDEE